LLREAGQRTVAAPPAPREALAEGCRVRLEGHPAKNGACGTALKRYKGGMWRVRIEGKSALVEEKFLMVEGLHNAGGVPGGYKAKVEAAARHEAKKQLQVEPRGSMPDHGIQVQPSYRQAGRGAAPSEASPQPVLAAPWAHPPAWALAQPQGAPKMFGFVKGVKEAGHAVASC